jgi:hypothetical protein
MATRKPKTPAQSVIEEMRERLTRMCELLPSLSKPAARKVMA